MSKLLYTFLACALYSVMAAQSQPPVTIDEVQVSYQSIASAEPPLLNGHPDMKVRAVAAISLMPEADASIIYLQMLDSQGQVLYDVNYHTADGSVSDNGLTLFEIRDNKIYIMNPNIVSLAAYTYKIYSKDAQGNTSLEFSTIQ